MGDQAALQEAIQRARQLAAKISQNAPATKRPASEMDDSHSIGTVKVTLAYEKPVNSDNNQKQQQLESTTQSHHRSSSNHRDNNSNYSSNKDSNHSSSRDRESSRDDHLRDRGDSAYSGSNGSNAYPSSRSSTNQPPMAGYGSMLGGASNNNYSGGSADARIEIIIPHAVIGLVIGKGGENIKRIQNETGATVRVDPNTVDEKGNKVCTITGTKEAVEEAHSQVANVIENAATNKRPRTQVEGSDQYRMKIPASRTGAIIGKGGETIKSIKQQSGCDIELDKGAKECGPDESVFVIRGTQDKILKARAMIEARLASRGRDGDNQRSNNPAPKGVATGANAAPVAQYPDMLTNYSGKFFLLLVVRLIILVFRRVCSHHSLIPFIPNNPLLFDNRRRSRATEFRRCVRRLGRLFRTIFQYVQSGWSSTWGH